MGSQQLISYSPAFAVVSQTSHGRISACMSLFLQLFYTSLKSLETNSGVGFRDYEHFFTSFLHISLVFKQSETKRNN